MSDYFKNFICVFFLIWSAIYLCECWVRFEILNPISVFWELPGDSNFRLKILLTLLSWLAATAMIAKVAYDFDWFGVNDE